MRRHLFLLLTFAAFLVGLYIAVLPAINEILLVDCKMKLDT